MKSPLKHAAETLDPECPCAPDWSAIVYIIGDMKKTMNHKRADREPILLVLTVIFLVIFDPINNLLI